MHQHHPSLGNKDQELTTVRETVAGYNFLSVEIKDVGGLLGFRIITMTHLLCEPLVQN